MSDAGDRPERELHPLSADVKEKLMAARARLLFMYPFFGYLVSNLEDRVGDTAVPTAGTDGALVHWSESFVKRISQDDTMFVLAHEAMHCALQHLWRRNGRDERRWNVACDACVNDILLEAGLRCATPLIKGANGRSAEEVYEDLEGVIKASTNLSTLDDHSGWNEAKPGDPAERNKSDVWKAALHQARSFGRVPASIARAFESVLNPKRDWRDLLRDGLFFPEDYQWVPTDRRFSSVLLPTLTGEIHRVVVAIDTSGSIHGQKLTGFWTELVAILRNNRCEARVLSCDAEIQDEFDEVSFDPSQVSGLKGGGGTNFTPVFDRVEKYIESGWRPEAVVYLTDLDGTFPPHAPDMRTFWIVGKEDAGKKAPFGEVIVLE